MYMYSLARVWIIVKVPRITASRCAVLLTKLLPESDWPVTWDDYKQGYNHKQLLRSAPGNQAVVLVVDDYKQSCQCNHKQPLKVVVGMDCNVNVLQSRPPVCMIRFSARLWNVFSPPSVSKAVRAAMNSDTLVQLPVLRASLKTCVYVDPG